MIKTIVIWLVKLLKLEEVFLAEFKAVLKARLNAKVANLDNVVKSIENSQNLFNQIESKAGGFMSYLTLGSADSLKKEFNAIESRVKQIQQEIVDEIEKL